MLSAESRAVLVFACTTAILGLAVMGEWTPWDTKADPTPKQPALETPAFALRAHELQAAFATNDAAATTRYKGKVIELLGVISVVSQSLAEWPAVLLETRDRCRDVVCYFPSYYFPQLRRMRKGQVVVIVGRCIGALDGFPRLRDCAPLR